MRRALSVSDGEPDPYYEMMLSWLARDREDGAEAGFLPERDTPPRCVGARTTGGRAHPDDLVTRSG